MKKLETPLTWVLGIVFISYIGITNLCKENKKSTIISSEKNKNLPAISIENINKNMPVINTIITEEEIIDSTNTEIADELDSILELADSLVSDSIEKFEE